MNNHRHGRQRKHRHLVGINVFMLLLSWIFFHPLHAAEPLRLQVQQKTIELRTGPGRAFPVINVALSGDWLIIQQQQTQWVQVSTDRQNKGWISVIDLQHLRTMDGLSGQPLATHLVGSPWIGAVTLGDFGGAHLLGVLLGYQWNDYLVSEWVVQQSLGDFAENTLYALQITHRSLPDNNWCPLFTLGTGKLITHPQTTLVSSTDRDDDFFKMAVGVSRRLNATLSLRAEYQNLLILTSREDNPRIDAWTLSISNRF
jgi:hypothetical protein